ncbi:epidermal growth factor receptor substrate 15-like 1 isoform X2 [Anthonomus grandis grandis]|uniref:epidermal growth factor receptor substrate 15-like 1 isoform X2 n=2 Tax=Anthonomus grandis grandis TaxID=2921223 RepID=UPI0021658A85|nr:epidermal growth factor receptor substrate 15-like 1 isoform X2 [Anthonomus grandis grandis]
MAALPSPTQVAGSHSHIYEAYYNLVDPNGFGTVGGMEAARFLKRSGLSDIVLSRIWDLSDPGGRGSLDKAGMFVALKLVALVQNGKDLSIKHVNDDVPPPKMGDIPLPKTKPPLPTTTPLITSLPPSAVDWTIKPTEREKYDKLFDSLQPTNGVIPGNKVKNVLMESKLPFDTLGKIWELADQDKDGMLNRHEFVVAMHLVYKALEKYAIPNTLPPELAPPLKRKDSSPPSVQPNLISSRPLDIVKPEVPPPPIIPAVKPVQSVQPTIPWVVSADEKAKSDMLFVKSDVDKDGFVSGGEIKDVFLRSGVPQHVLAHIWALCDIKQTGKLNNEQFALAMWFVARCLKGVEPPPALTPEMVPPTFRTGKAASEGLVENNNTRYSNPELDMISKDIEVLAKERLALESDIAQKEADIKIKSGEIKNLQSELDTLAATLKQLENQKGEAQKRLNDLKAQKGTLELEHAAIDKELGLATEQVDKLRAQANEQAELVATQETELKSKKEQLDGLRQEEQTLENQKNDYLKKLESLTSNLQETQLNISQVKALTTQLQEQTRQINDAIVLCENAIEMGDASQVPEQALRIAADFQEYSRLAADGENKENDPFGRQNGSNSGFDDDPFQNDPFRSKSASSIANDPFNESFNSKISNGGFPSDPFSSFNSTQPDPFASSNFDKNPETLSEVGKDPFGCDPFAVLHAPTRDSVAGDTAPGRPASPSPALPPKKSKQPPPRPAPPRPAVPPAPKKQDAFGSEPFDAVPPPATGGGFADFSNFEAKCAYSSAIVDVTIPPSRPVEPCSGPFPYCSTPIWSPHVSSLSAKPAAPPPKLADFADDPFKDYRYEDPFNIKFDEEEEEKDEETQRNKNNKSKDSLFHTFSEDKFDPFGLEGRQSVPLPAAPFDAFKGSGRTSAPPLTLTEVQQMAWAERESLKAEEERRKRREMEDAEFEMALRLSKIDGSK